MSKLCPSKVSILVMLHRHLGLQDIHRCYNVSLRETLSSGTILGKVILALSCISVND